MTCNAMLLNLVNDEDIQTMGTNGPEDMYLTSLGKKGLVDRSA